mgnify:CR=1 FL=1
MSDTPHPLSPNPSDIKRILEAALLAAQDALSIAELRRMFDEELDASVLRRLLDELRDDWSGRGVELIQVASGWRFRTRADLQPYLEKLKNEKPPRYSRAVLETLAIIAYKQPVTKSELESIRGVSCDYSIQRLLEKNLIAIAGKSDGPGRPTLYTTSPFFMEYFGINGLHELPQLKELEQTDNSIGQEEA